MTDGIDQSTKVKLEDAITPGGDLGWEIVSFTMQESMGVQMWQRQYAQRVHSIKLHNIQLQIQHMELDQWQIVRTSLSFRDYVANRCTTLFLQYVVCVQQLV